MKQGLILGLICLLEVQGQFLARRPISRFGGRGGVSRQGIGSPRSIRSGRSRARSRSRTGPRSRPRSRSGSRSRPRFDSRTSRDGLIDDEEEFDELPTDFEDDFSETERDEGCSRHYVRKEVRDLNSREFTAFIDALETMKQSGAYDRLCRIHVENIPFAHATPYFLPWHREFTNRFERELQKIDPSIALPYWDWSIDSQAPERSEILSPEYFGGQGGRCINNGPFSGWRCSHPDSHCLSRKFDGGESLGAFYSPELLSFTLDDRKSYDEFRNAIEGPPHGNVHNNIGGDMSTMASCNDPLFYLHHGMVDKLWLEWQRKDPSFIMDFSGKLTEGGEASLNDILVPFDKEVRDTMDVAESYCYSYQDSSLNPSSNSRKSRRHRNERRGLSILGQASDFIIPYNIINQQPQASKFSTASSDFHQSNSNISPGPHDRFNMNHLRTVTPLTQEYIQMFGLNETRVRAQEEQDRDFIENLNLMGYISKFSLGNLHLLKDLSNTVDSVSQLITNNQLLSRSDSQGEPLIDGNDFNIIRTLIS